MNNKFRQVFVATTLAVAIISTMLMPQPAAAAEDPFEIPVILPLTGGASFLGKGEQEALHIVQKVVNNQGGIHGQQLHFVYYDDQSSPQTAVQLVSQAIARRPKVVFGSALVGMCNAMAPLMAKGPVMYCFSPGIHPNSGSYVFTSSVNTKDVASSQVRYFRLKGWKKIALITSTDASGQDAERAVKEAMALPENKDMQLVDNEHFNPSDISVSAQIEHIKAMHPDCVIAWSSGAPIGTVFKAMAQVGLNLPIATTYANMTYAQMTQYASFLPKQLYIASSEWPEHTKGQNKKVVKANQEFHSSYKSAGIQPDISSSLAWDPAMIVIDALRKLDRNASAEQIRAYISKLKGYAGVNGVYDFSANPQRGLDENDVVITIWSPAEKTWKIISNPRGIPL